MFSLNALKTCHNPGKEAAATIRTASSRILRKQIKSMNNEPNTQIVNIWFDKQTTLQQTIKNKGMNFPNFYDTSTLQIQYIATKLPNKHGRSKLIILSDFTDLS